MILSDPNGPWQLLLILTSDNQTPTFLFSASFIVCADSEVFCTNNTMPLNLLPLLIGRYMYRCMHLYDIQAAVLQHGKLFVIAVVMLL